MQINERQMKQSCTHIIPPQQLFEHGETAQSGDDDQRDDRHPDDPPPAAAPAARVPADPEPHGHLERAEERDGGERPVVGAEQRAAAAGGPVSARRSAAAAFVAPPLTRARWSFMSSCAASASCPATSGAVAGIWMMHKESMHRRPCDCAAWLATSEMTAGCRTL
ncbi:hypothetical protein BS78_06G218100 [Paspalum vaginatum]|nr:hypothetical protein BS78_06G218100 [Paspalum vaginatum]